MNFQSRSIWDKKLTENVLYWSIEQFDQKETLSSYLFLGEKLYKQNLHAYQDRMKIAASSRFAGRKPDFSSSFLSSSSPNNEKMDSRTGSRTEAWLECIRIIGIACGPVISPAIRIWCAVLVRDKCPWTAAWSNEIYNESRDKSA